MSWKFELAEWSSSSITVANDLLERLRKLDPHQAASAKVVISDQNRGKAKGALFYYDGPWSLPEKSTNNWQLELFKTGNNSEYDDLCEKITSFLNQRSLDRALTAHIACKDGQRTVIEFAVWIQQD
jgi:hypothetical protein